VTMALLVYLRTLWISIVSVCRGRRLVLPARRLALRIAIIANQAFAMRNFRGSLISALNSAGVAVVAFAPDYSEADREQIRAWGAEPADYSLARATVDILADFRTLYQLIRLLHSNRFDAILTSGAKPVIYGTIAASTAKVKRKVALIEGLGHAFITGGSTLRRSVSFLYRIALQRADRVVFLNDDDINDFVSANIVPSSKVAALRGIGVELDHWRMAPPPVDPLRFLFVGRLLIEKGIYEFVEAARRVKQLHPDVRFTILGGPDSNPSSATTEEAKAWVDQGLVDWPGHVDVKPWMERCSVFVLPSYREGVPRSTQEAMASGRPIITTDVPGCRETVIQNDNGYLVPHKDANALAQAMLRFVRSPALVTQMGERSRCLAEERFDARKADQELMKLLGVVV